MSTSAQGRTPPLDDRGSPGCRHPDQLFRPGEHFGRGAATPARVPPDADRPRPAVQRIFLVLRHSPGSGRHDPRPVRGDERQPNRRVPVGRGVGAGRLRHRIRHHFRRARPARRRRGPRLPGQFQGDRLLVPARRARHGDGDFRRRGQILQRHRRTLGRLRRRRVRLAMGLRPDGRAELRLFPGLLDPLSRSEPRREAHSGRARLYPRGRRRCRGPFRGQFLLHARLPAQEPEGLGTDHRFRRLRLFLLPVSDLAARLPRHRDAHEHHQIGRLRRDPLAVRLNCGSGSRRLADRQADPAGLR